MDMQVFITNLGKYNEGELVGEWFTPPINMEEVAEKIGLNQNYEEFFITDYELPFEIDEYTPISRINALCEMIEDIEGTAIYKELKQLVGYFFNSVEELLESQDDIVVYDDCYSMEDVAHVVIEELGMLGELPERLQSYFDYEAFGRDLEIEGSFLVTSNGVFEYRN